MLLLSHLSRSSLPYVRWDGDPRDRKTHSLPLAAAQASHRIPHQQKLCNILRPQLAAPKTLPRAELALDRDAVIGIQSQVRGFVRGVGSFSALAGGLVLVLEFHFQR